MKKLFKKELKGGHFAAKFYISDKEGGHFAAKIYIYEREFSENPTFTFLLIFKPVKKRIIEKR